MRTLLAMIVGFCLTSSGSAADFAPFSGPRPIVVFIQSDPWGAVIGSDTPRVAIYENGDVIFAKKVNGQFAYHHVTLDRHELEKVRERLRPVLSLKHLKPQYDIRPGATDQPVAMFYVSDGGHEVATSVYGLMAAGTRLPAYIRSVSGAIKSTPPPKELFKLHQWLCELDYAGSKAWVPRYVEVMLWDYSYAPEPSVQWPKEWPGLHSDRALKREGSYSIFLDGALLPELRKLLATRNEKGAVEVEGKKMAASYRFTFPGEPIWRRAFRGTN